MVLAGIGALVVLGTVVLPLVGWLLHSLGWIVAGVLVIGGGVWLAKRIGGRDDAEAVVRSPEGKPLG